MLFDTRRKVDEDLEKIRFANLPPEVQGKEIEEKKKRKEEFEAIEFEKNDRLAIIIAVFSIVIPYLLAFLGIIGAVLLLFYYVYL